MNELNIITPSKYEVEIILIRKTLAQIVNKEIDAVRGLSYIYDKIYLDMDKEVVGDRLNFCNIFGWLREIWDCRDGSPLNYYANLPRGKAEIKIYEHLIEESKKWLESN